MSYCIYEKVPPMQDVLEAEASGRVNISRSGDYLIAKYTQQTTFACDWDDVTMHCRGIVYYEPTGECIALPFKKFFNHLENSLDYTHLPSDSISRAEILEKKDGSMSLIFLDHKNQLRVSTPGSLESDQAQWAQSWLRKHESYNEIRRMFLNCDVRALIGEIIYKGSQVVVNYDYEKEAGIHIIAAQLNKDGKWQYANHDELLSLAKSINFKCCDIYNFSDFEELKNHLSKVSDFEGFVLHWPETGFRLKMKADEYIRLHRIVTNIHPNRIEEAIMCHESENAQSFSEVFDVIERVITDFPEEHRQPYEYALRMIRNDTLEIYEEVSETTNRIMESHSQFVGAAQLKACAIDIKNKIPKKFQSLAFSLMRDSKIKYSRIALLVWKSIKPKMEW